MALVSKPPFKLCRSKIIIKTFWGFISSCMSGFINRLDPLYVPEIHVTLVVALCYFTVHWHKFVSLVIMPFYCYFPKGQICPAWFHKGMAHRLKFIPRAKSTAPKADPKARGVRPGPARLHRSLSQHCMVCVRLRLELSKICCVVSLQLPNAMQPLDWSFSAMPVSDTTPV